MDHPSYANPNLNPNPTPTPNPDSEDSFFDNDGSESDNSLVLKSEPFFENNGSDSEDSLPVGKNSQQRPLILQPRRVYEDYLRCASFFENDGSNSEDSLLVGKNYQQRKRLVDILDAGIHLLLDHNSSLGIALGHSLLCLQVVLRVEHEQMEGEYRSIAKKTLASTEQHPTSYELEVEDATGLLLDYSAYWIDSLSMVLVDLNGWQDKVCARDLMGRGKAKYKGVEVTLFVLADCVIDDQAITNHEELKKFLEELSEKQIQRVYATCLSVTYQEEGSNYNHVII